MGPRAAGLQRRGSDRHPCRQGMVWPVQGGFAHGCPLRSAGSDPTWPAEGLPPLLPSLWMNAYPTSYSSRRTDWLTLQEGWGSCLGVRVLKVEQGLTMWLGPVSLGPCQGARSYAPAAGL